MVAVPVPRVAKSLEARANAVREELWFGDDDPDRTAHAAQDSLAAATALCVGLKPFPAVAAKAMELVQDPDVTVRHLADCIETDPIIAARLLQVANSVLYRPAQPYVSIEQAVVRLGLDSVVELVVGIATMQLMHDESGLGAEVRRHSAGVAAVSRLLGMEMKFVGVGRTFLAALLHDIGKLLIAQAGEFEYGSLPESATGPDEVHIYERVKFGYDHAVLGAHVLHEWEFPAVLCRAVALHHQPSRAAEEGGELTKMVALIRGADAFVHGIAEDADPDRVSEIAKRFVSSTDGHALPFSAAVLEGMWPRMCDAHAEMVGLLG